MSAQGGSVKSLTINGRRMSAPADADFNVYLGGPENAGEPNGDGTARKISTGKLWSIANGSVVIDHDRGDQEYLHDVSELSDVPIAIEYVNGDVFQGTGFLTGEYPYSSQSASANIELMGPGNLTKQ
mgnify:CR=1 FL=1|tara:strand:- start:1026 stop:1406 length:381 start_codon:yes stop_codon:yes gene_type:complete